MNKLVLAALSGLTVATSIAMICGSCLTSAGAVRVAGTVLLDGQPLAGADVFLLSDQGAQPMTSVHAQTDNQGRYRLIRGARPGAYKVIVRATVGGELNETIPTYGLDGVDDMQLQIAANARAETEQHLRSRRPDASIPRPLPETYSSAAYTILRIDIPTEGTNSADLNLTLSRSTGRPAVSERAAPSRR